MSLSSDDAVMPTPTLGELGKRAVACKHWRWVPGMLTHQDGYSVRICSVAEDGTPCIVVLDGDILKDCCGYWEEARDEGGVVFLPDLSDPATLGCLLHLVREAYEDPRQQVIDLCDIFHLNTFSFVFKGPLYPAETLVKALEAAP